MTTVATNSRKMTFFIDTVMTFEKLTEQLNGESCSPGFIAKTPETISGQCKVWLDHLERGNKKIVQYCLDSDGHILYLRAIQGHSEGNGVDLSLQDNVQIPYAWIDYIDHVFSLLSCNSII